MHDVISAVPFRQNSANVFTTCGGNDHLIRLFNSEESHPLYYNYHHQRQQRCTTLYSYNLCAALSSNLPGSGTVQRSRCVSECHCDVIGID
ncbi:hypothetical protein TYRP_020882 [Tyrophagus putrescentiae]|nr:hypothetical protein TYRP_020882 [Tyrophagus putrescentiae]